jgi:hypothetical protein
MLQNYDIIGNVYWHIQEIINQENVFVDIMDLNYSCIL